MEGEAEKGGGAFVGKYQREREREAGEGGGRVLFSRGSEELKKD